VKEDRERRWYRSTRFRITAPAVLIVAALVGVGSIFLVESVQSNQLSQIDGIISGGAQYAKHEMAAHQSLQPRSPKGLYGQLLTSDGRLVGSSLNLDRSGPLTGVAGVGTKGRFLTVDTRDYGTLRLYELKLAPTHDAPILVEGISMAGVSADTSSLSARLSLVAPILVLIVAALIWFVVGRAMRPVDRVRRKAADISVTNLNERIANPGTGDELEHLVTTLNALLGRLEGALERERRFVADASHEFRSPLAAIRANLEAEMALVREPSDTQRAILRGVLRLQDLADELLVFEQSTRSDVTAPSLVDLDELMLSEIDHVAGRKDITIVASEVSGGQVIGQELDFSRIIDNLTSNALRHARTTVAFGVSETKNHVEFFVADDGDGVRPDERSEVFEPFSRPDGDRGRGSGGAGLGLAIVAELVAKYNGDVRVECDPLLGGARFTVSLPSAGIHRLDRPSLASAATDRLEPLPSISRS
jgi:signal transduction histidine kinase